MRVCFLVPELRPSGGIAVVLEHARRLGDHAIEAEVMVAGDPRARESEWDVAIATFWTTWPELHELRSRRRAVFLQSVEARFYRDTEPFDRLGADAALAQDAGYFVVAGWMRDLLAAVRPGVPVWHIPNGIDKARFSGGDGPRREGPLRVLVEGQPSLWFKGVPEAAAAVRAMERPAELTVVALDPAHARELGADRVVGGLDADGMAALYRETDVLLKLSRVEGLPLPPLEAFHCGVPCIVTPFTGHEDYVQHGSNGAVTGFDDRDAVTAWLDRLADDRDLLARLSDGARATATRWPDPAAATRVLAGALRELAEGPAPVAGPAMARTIRHAIETGREHLRQRDVDLAGVVALSDRRHEQIEELWAKIDELNEHIAELERSRLHVNELLLQREAELEELRNSRAYRASVAARNLVKRGK
jgi:O-antigen biosynthesis protein